jgi:excisionase family DNA binding protein
VRNSQTAANPTTRLGDGLTEAEREGPFEPFQLYLAREIAKPMGISQRQATRWLYEGRLPYVRLHGRGRRLRGRDLNKFINERLVAPDTDGR